MKSKNALFNPFLSPDVHPFTYCCDLFSSLLKQAKHGKTSLIKAMDLSYQADFPDQLKESIRKEIEFKKTLEIQNLAYRAVPPIVPNDLFSALLKHEK